MKATKAEIQKRVTEILTIRLQGAEFQDIVQYSAEQGWQVEERQLWNYIAAGDRLLAETLEKDRQKLVNRHIAQRRALYARAMQVGDLGTARAVLRDEAELLNLYPAKRLEHSGQGGGPILTKELSDHELGAIILRGGRGANGTPQGANGA